MSIERKSIDVVTVAERHGRARDQMYFWFVGHFQFLTLAVGFIGPSRGLSLTATLLAGALGVLFGSLFTAFHATQGPELGLPQMIQSRAQFGFRGGSVVLVAPLLSFIGLNAANALLIGHVLHACFGIAQWSGVLLTAIAGLALAFHGHDGLHRLIRWCFLLCLPLYGLLTISLFKGFIPVHPIPLGGFTWSAFMTQFALSASCSLSYAPAISDYTRYLPRATSRSTLVTSVYLGTSASAIWLIALGAWLAIRLGTTDALVALGEAGDALLGSFGTVLVLATTVALTAVTGLNAYSGMLTALTGLSALLERPLSPHSRLLCLLVLATIWTTLALSLSSVPGLLIFLALLRELLAPWTAINLIDYFLVRRGRYAVMELFAPDGIYGAWNPHGLIAYAAGVVAALLFGVLDGVYAGPLAHTLGGVDFGWLAGLVVSGMVYHALSRSYDPAREDSAAGESARLLAALEADRVSS